jgi:hypothetical protein
VRASALSDANLPPLRLAGFCSDRSKNPVATAPGSDHENADGWRPATIYKPRTTNHERAVRRQLFDDSMNTIYRVMGDFLILRGFLETT